MIGTSRRQGVGRWGSPRPRRRGLYRTSRSVAGGTLIEATIALAILGIVLLAALLTAASSRRIERRAEAHLLADEAVLSTLELIRSGLPVTTGTSVLDLSAHGLTPPDLPGWRIEVETSPRVPTGLFSVTVIARYLAAGRRVERRVESLLWRS